jgi:hypothetical protein
VRDGAADRAHVPDLRIADLRRGVRDDRAPLLERFGVADVVMPRERADRDPVAVLPNVREVGEPPDVHERRRSREPELHRGQERMPARQELRILAGPEQRDRLVDRSRPHVVEGRRDHAEPPFALLIVRQTFSGVAGRGISVTPRCESASTTAFNTAGGDAIVPVSPTPLMPMSFVVDGVTWFPVTNDGISVAEGTA